MTSEEIELLSKLTILIPTYNRPYELERAIEYWRSTPVNVTILDGSEMSHFSLEILSSIPNVSYHHLPQSVGDSWRQNYVHRLDFARSLTKTKYSALCADDDYFSVSGLVASLRVLEDNADLDAVVGKTLGFEATENLVRWWLRYGPTSVGNASSWSDDPIVRLERGSLRLYYGVVRTDLWNLRIDVTREHVWLGERWETLFQDVGRALFRATTINQIVWFRFKTQRRPHETSYQYLREWANSQEDSVDVASYVDILVKTVLLQSPNSDKNKIYKKIQDVVKNHPESRNQSSELKLLMSRIIEYFLAKINQNVPRYIPENVRDLALDQYIPTKIKAAIGPKQVLDEFLPKLQDTGIKFIESELRDLESLLMKPREELRLRADI
jgi:glycosyltransferase domain-containing protein